MNRLFLLLLLFSVVLSAFFQSCQGKPAENTLKNIQVKIVANEEILALAQPPVIKQDVVYISSADMENLPGLSVDYRADAGDITVTGKNETLDLRVNEPLKEGDKNGPRPFLEAGVLYLPLTDIVSRLSYDVRQEKDSGGRVTIILQKSWTDNQDIWKPFSAEELKYVEAVFAKGVTINDPQNDWALISEGLQPDGRKDNGQPYPISFTDIKSLTFGADEQYLYIKVELYDIIPKDVPYWQNTQYNQQDFIMGMGCNFDLFSFFNRNTGKQDQGLMQTGISWVEGDPRESINNPQFVNPPYIGTSSFATNSGTRDKNNEDIYTMSSGDGRVAGGAGYNYFIGAFVLKNFGLQLGDTIDCDVSMEVGSKLFHHECVDIILNNNYKTGNLIRWQIGANTYEDLGPPENVLPLDAK